MSLKIKKLTGETFDLPPDYVIEAEKNNPLFTTKGSKTVPIHFPNTDNNRKLLLNTDRLDRRERPDTTFPVVIETGAMQQSGLMAISAPFNAGIGFDESEMYNQMTTMKLRDIPLLKDPVNHPQFHRTGAGNTLDDKVTDLVNHLNQVMKEEVDTDYFVFPVVLDLQLVEREDETDAKYFTMLNQAHLIAGQKAGLFASEAREIKRYIEGEEVIIQAPKGYGVSPFIKVWKVLEIIFEYYGFTIKENPFKEHRQLKKLVVLNNVIDSILTGTLYYKDMMPDITIQQFLDGLYNKFGLLYYLNSNSKTVSLKFLKDIIVPLASGIMDLHPFKTQEPTVTYAAPKQLKLVMNRQLEGCEVLQDTYEEFLKRYNSEFTEEGDPRYAHSTQVFQTTYSKYLIISAIQEKSLLSSDFFDYDKKDALEYEEIKMDDLCLPFSKPIDEIPYLFYGVNYKGLYTDLIIGGEQSGGNENPAPLAFTFGWGNQTRSGFTCFFASPINRDIHGNFMYYLEVDNEAKKYDISLTCNREDGLFNRFWKYYDAFLRHSNFEVKCDLKMTCTEILDFEMFRTAIVNNEFAIMKQIRYKLNQPDSIPECLFQTLRFYEPYELEKEQEIPHYSPQKYYWKTTRVDIPTLQDMVTQGYTEISGYSHFNKYPDKIEVDGVEFPTSQVFIYPPTEAQYFDQDEITYQYDWFARIPGFPQFPKTGVSYFTLKPELL